MSLGKLRQFCQVVRQLSKLPLVFQLRPLLQSPLLCQLVKLIGQTS
jgi:hypothetical protein